MDIYNTKIEAEMGPIRSKHLVSFGYSNCRARNVPRTAKCGRCHIISLSSYHHAPHRSNLPKVSSTAPPARSPPVALRVHKRGPSNTDDNQQTQPKMKKLRADDESEYEEERK